MRKRAHGCLLLLLLFLLLPCVCTANQADTITIPTEQWNELKTVLVQQQSELNLLEADLMLLKTPSSELIENLQKARSQLEKSETELLLAKRELSDAKNSMQELSRSLTALKESIANDREEQQKQLKRAKTERNIALIIAGLFLIKG